MLFAVRGLLAMRADGTTVDEPLHLAYGERALSTGTFLRDSEALNSKMPVSVLNAIPVAVAGRGRTLSWGRQLFLARLPTLLLGILLGFLVWRWAQALFGAAGGALALLLYTCCPNVLAHAHLVTTDIATALGMFAAVYCLWRYFDRPSGPRLAIAAAVFGLAQLTKATAILLVPILALILVVRAFQAVRQRRGTPTGPESLDSLDSREPAPTLARAAARSGAIFLLFGIVTVVTLNLGFRGEGTFTPLGRYAFVSTGFKALGSIPLLRELPLPLPYAYVQGLDMVSHDALAESWSYLRGRYSQSGFRSYFLWGFLVKVPLATQVLLVLALWLWCRGRARAPGAEAFLVVPVAVLLLDLSLFFRLDIGFRYFLPALPFLFVFAARVAAPGGYLPLPLPSAWQAAGRRAVDRPASSRAAAAWRASAWRAAAAGGFVAWLVASSFSVHPHYLAYFNELAGGPANGWCWLIDSNLDWGQDDERVRQVVAARGPGRALIDPSGPVAGRIAVGVSNLIGRDPAAARRHAWLRDNFRPIATIGYSWKLFDVGEADLARCCAQLPRAWVIDDLAADVALDGEPFAGGEGVTVRFAEKLNDGMLGANEPVDAARTLPPRPRPVRAWFGVRWSAPRTLGRVVAFPGFASRGPQARRFLALDYVFQSWDGTRWRDVPGTRTLGNQAPRVEHRFPPLTTSAIRIVVERERNDHGGEDLAGGFRAACLEVAAYPP
ncbi:MAG TPA: glycosyltransferase family 39 protein [Thermoanaerobaculia bacterium]|nr:glycosyltransferase family 39 protein [Thermoanaerobaculia bacterium]